MFAVELKQLANEHVLDGPEEREDILDVPCKIHTCWLPRRQMAYKKRCLGHWHDETLDIGWMLPMHSMDNWEYANEDAYSCGNTTWSSNQTDVTVPDNL